MSHQSVVKWGILIIFVMSLLSGCGGSTPTPIFVAVEPTSTPIPPPVPTTILPRPATRVATITPWPVATEVVSPTPTGGTLTPEPSLTLPAPIDRPFLMKIDRISVIAGRGTLLQGRVANGTLQGNASVDIFGPQNEVISGNVVALVISNTTRDQVTVGDYAGILVAGVEATSLRPGMLLAPADEFESYEEALLQLQ